MFSLEFTSPEWSLVWDDKLDNYLILHKKSDLHDLFSGADYRAKLEEISKTTCYNIVVATIAAVWKTRESLASL